MISKDSLQLTPLRARSRPCRFLRAQGAFRLGPAEYDETTRSWCVRSLQPQNSNWRSVYNGWRFRWRERCR